MEDDIKATCKETMSMSPVLQKLKGGDLRSKGKSEEVVQDILKNPQLFGELFEGMLLDDPIVRMRAADAIEKVSSIRPEYLQPFKDRLINEVSKIRQQEVRWHVAQMFSYLEVNKEERNKIIEILFSWIDSEKSKIVIVNSMQTLAKFGEKNKDIRVNVLRRIEEIIKTGSPAIVSIGKKLINKLKE